MSGVVERLAAILGTRIPGDAIPIKGDGCVALAWVAGRAYVPGQGRGAVVLYSVDGRKATIGRLTCGLDRPSEAIEAMRGNPRARGAYATTLLRDSVVEPDWTGGSDERREALLALAATLDAAAIVAMDDAGLTHSGCEPFLSSRHPDTAAAHAFASEHPWLVGPAAQIRPVMDRDALAGGPDAMAAAVLARVIGREDSRIPGLVDRMRAFVLPEMIVGAVDPANVEGLLAIPADRFPPKAGRGRDGAGQQGFLAMYALASGLDVLARLSDRPMRSLVGGGNDWEAYAQALAARTGLDDTPEDHPGSWGAILGMDVQCEIYDMTWAFANEILAPVLLAQGRPWVGVVSEGRGGRRLGAADEDPVFAAALGLLLGQRSLAGLAETCGRWQGRADDIARHVAFLSGPDAPKGPKLFDDVELEDGHYMTCLNAVPDLLDEGAPGPDATGAMGLRHCVGGYGHAVSFGQTAIVSIRRRLAGGGFERVSTAEVQFGETGSDGGLPRVVQHRGRRNATPGAEAKAFLALGLALVHREARETLLAFRPDRDGWSSTAEIVHRAGAWESMRDLWSFALPRPLRGLDAAGMLAAAGIGDPTDDAGFGPGSLA